jgi:hypothetical protein
MQSMKARLSTPIEPRAFEKAWNAEQQGPPVRFAFNDRWLTLATDRWDP